MYLTDAKFDCKIQLHYMLVLITVCCHYFVEVHVETLMLARNFMRK